MFEEVRKIMSPEEAREAIKPGKEQMKKKTSRRRDIQRGGGTALRPEAATVSQTPK